MENTEVEHPWDQEEEDELEEGLVARRKNLHQTSINGDFSTHNVESVGEDHLHHQQEDEEDKDFIHQNDIKVDEDEKEMQKQQISEYCVFYDTDKDIGNSCVPENTDITINNQEHKNGMPVITKQNVEHQRHEISFEGDKSGSSYIHSKTEITNVDELTEYDVETVLKKQDTHDLFCPNCNSCITKRVILRKRKRRIKIPSEDSKRSKPQAQVSSELNVSLDDSSDNQALNGVDSRFDDVQPPTSNEYDHQREPDVFRCLSCFSLFMPTGNGFKLFRVFGNKTNEESNEHSQTEEVAVKKSWFTKFLRSEKMEYNVTDLNDSGPIQSLDAKNNVIGVSSASSSSMQEAESHTTNDTTDLRKDQLQSDKVISESNGKMATDSTLADIQEQLLTSYDAEKASYSKSEHPDMFLVKPPLTSVEPAENSISPLQHDGLKLLGPPNVGSLIIDNSQMKQELDVTVQTNNPGSDEKGRTNLSFSSPASKLEWLNSSSQVNSLGLPINLAINGKEQKMTKDSVSVQSREVMPEVSQHTIRNNVEIHLEEPLKVNKAVLTDKQINPLEDAKNNERIKVSEKETIITIESKQLDALAFQRPPDTLGATGTPALQQAVEQGGVTTGSGGSRSLDIIKSLVYGGLIELITSLSVVSSAAGADATTSNVLALGLANIFGGLFVISHDLCDLKNERRRKTEDRYQQLLGQRADFPLHMIVSLISYLVFGFLPPVVYGFSFHESNDKDLKLLVVAAASILCIMILAAGKAYVQSPQKSYFKTVGYYVVFGFIVSGVSYVVGGLIIKLLEKMDMFHDGSVENLHIHGEGTLATF